MLIWVDTLRTRVLPTQGRVGRFPARTHNIEALDRLQMRSAND